jgi:hypothetical protein
MMTICSGLSGSRSIIVVGATAKVGTWHVWARGLGSIWTRHWLRRRGASTRLLCEPQRPHHTWVIRASFCDRRPARAQSELARPIRNGGHTRMTTSRSTVTHARPVQAPVSRRATVSRRLREPSPMSDLPLALWPCAQRTNQARPFCARVKTGTPPRCCPRSHVARSPPTATPVILSLTQCAGSPRHSSRRST